MTIKHGERQYSLFNILIKQYSGTENLLNSAPSLDNFQRAYVRETYACIEGILFFLKEDLLQYCKTLTVEQTVLLKEESYRIDDKGGIRTNTSFANFAPKTKFILKTCNFSYSQNDNFDFSDNGFSSFLEGHKIRNRITHPKSIEDLNLTEEDISKVREGFLWFEKVSMHVYIEMLKKREPKLLILSQKLT